MRTDRLSFEEQPRFERVITGLVGTGAVIGMSLIPFHDLWPVGHPLSLAVITACALLGAKSLRGSQAGVSAGMRTVAVFAAGAIGLCLESVSAMVVAMGAVAGLALVGEGASNRRQAIGLVAGIAGPLWAMWAVPAVLRLVPDLPQPARSVAGGVLSAVFFGAGLALIHVHLHADAVSARLKKVGGETGVRLQRLWERCYASLLRAPGEARREVLGLLETNAREAERLAGLLVTLDARLLAADRTDAESQVAQLKSEAVATTDAITRARLSSAAVSLSDSLEALDALERKRERLGAELKLKLATLERAALALETAQGEPAELKTLVLRLTQSAAAA